LNCAAMLPVGCPPLAGTVSVVSAHVEAVGVSKQCGAPPTSEANDMMICPSTMSL